MLVFYSAKTLRRQGPYFNSYFDESVNDSFVALTPLLAGVNITVTISNGLIIKLNMSATTVNAPMNALRHTSRSGVQQMDIFPGQQSLIISHVMVIS